MKKEITITAILIFIFFLSLFLGIEAATREIDIFWKSLTIFFFLVLSFRISGKIWNN